MWGSPAGDGRGRPGARRVAGLLGASGAVGLLLAGPAPEPAHAQDPPPEPVAEASSAASPVEERTLWLRAWDTMLDEALWGTTASTGARFEALLDASGTADPGRAMLLYELGNAAWLNGDTDRAREALDACIRGGIGGSSGDAARRGRCLDLRAAIDLETDAVREVPVLWTFGDAEHGFVHPREFWDQGTIRLLTPADGPGPGPTFPDGALMWATQVDPLREDQLVVAFRGVAPRQVRLRIASRLQDAAVQLRLYDVEGQGFLLPARPVKLAVGEVVDVVARLTDAVPEGGGPGGLVVERLDRLVLVDRTSLVGGIGVSELVIDAFEVR